jgi:hypothetical protein
MDSVKLLTSSVPPSFLHTSKLDSLPLSFSTNMPAIGYQSIPNTTTCIDVVEDGHFGDDTSSEHPSRARPSTSTTSPTSPLQSLHGSITLSKLGYILVGFLVGYCNSKYISGWDPAYRFSFRSTDVYSTSGVSRTSGVTPSSDFLQHGQQQSHLINGKSFLDSLPFEDIVPQGMDMTLWNPAQPRPTEEKLPITYSKLDVSNVLSTAKDESKLLSISSIAASLSAPSPISTSSNSKTHILYHASEAAFQLLYDSSNSKNYYLSEYALDYFLLSSSGFDAQINQAYCAVASVAAMLNSLRYSKRFRDVGDVTEWSFDLPKDPRYDPYPYATQQDILVGDCVWNNVIEHGDGTGTGSHGSKVDGIFKPPYGLSLEQASNLVKCHTSASDWDVTVQEVDPSKVSLSKMRYDLKSALIDPDSRVMINYDRKGIGQVGGGHFSPLGAYHASTDSFLVMDVAKYKYPPVWVGADTLFDAMATVDNCGSYDFPQGQERLTDDSSGGSSNGVLLNPMTTDDYTKALKVLGCKQKMRGYLILKKKA